MNNKQAIIIGSKELVGLPTYSIADVPAKIDTGADFSAIWASKIEATEGVLTFCLFGPGSKFYTGEKISTKDYGVTQVKNSFGQIEERYKLKITLQLAGKRIVATVRLASRSQNKYPLLIGKKTLNSRFLVDVAKDELQNKGGVKGKVIILSSKASKNVDKFAADIRQTYKIDCDSRIYDDFVIKISNGDGVQISDVISGKQLDSYQLIYFKTHFEHPEYALVFAEYALSNGIEFYDREVENGKVLSKLTQYVKLVKAGIPVPQTILISHKYISGCYEDYKSVLGTPFIMKEAFSERGELNYLVKNENDFKAIAKKAVKEKLYFLGQRYIENEGDYRLIVLYKDVSLILHRISSNKSTHLNNTSTGGKATLIKLDAKKPGSAVKVLAVKAAMALKRQVAGVDFIQDISTKKWYVLEVNNSPQLYGGAFTDEKLRVFARFLKEQLRK